MHSYLFHIKLPYLVYPLLNPSYLKFRINSTYRHCALLVLVLVALEGQRKILESKGATKVQALVNSYLLGPKYIVLLIALVKSGGSH